MNITVSGSFAMGRLCRGVLVLVCLATAVCAQAQMQRPIPDTAKRGVIRHLHGMAVSIDNATRQLAPGAQIRDRGNFIIVPAALPEDGALAEYTVDASDQVFRVWLLTEQEAARPKKPPVRQ